MSELIEIEQITKRLSGIEKELRNCRERVLADAVMIGEIPSPTFGEDKAVRFLTDRFRESDLDNISIDEAGNASAILRGKKGKRNILIAAHVDKIWEECIDHTITVSETKLTGPGIVDNALGVAALTALPNLLEILNIKLDSNLVFLGASRSMGRGDLHGLRFFTDNFPEPLHAALCLEGVQLGRLSYSSLGMNRIEIQVNTPEERDWESWSLSGAIVGINYIIEKILRIKLPEVPKSSIILGSVMAGSSFNVPPTGATLRLEIRSEEPGMVRSIREEIEEIIEQLNAEQQAGATINVLARRKPGTIGFDHPLVRTAREVMKELSIEPTIAPSTSELSVLLQKNIPSLTLGLSSGENKHRLDESLEIEPIFKGLTQLIGLILAIDKGVCDE